ncbi:hypothetical protein BDW59DRAFT_162837 [Aspergillus cavernicola]|uniref:FAD-binding PCMH-type domain-containing protein n=1 Tax=Aspergillus cavernicola TaxID=176166 RepID=A0ABR4I800_9EURO
MPKGTPIHHYQYNKQRIQYVTPSSTDFHSLRSIFAHPEILPSAILRPASIQDIQATITFLAEQKIPFTIRSGGHDMHGRSTQPDTVVLDIRRINSVMVNLESGTATIGGGALVGNVVGTLQGEGFVTPVGSLSWVGYVGWAMYGGYGPYSARLGLGVDQILGARLANARGELVEADKDLLKGIRGARGAFGVVVEVTVSIYKLDQILAGVVMYNSEDLTMVIRQYYEGYRALTAEGLPAPFQVHQAVLNMPTPTFGVLFVLAPVMAQTVQLSTPAAWLEEADKLVAKTTQGRMWTITMRQITDEVVQVIAQYTKNMPADPHKLFDMHELRGGSPSARPNQDSVFSTHEPHFVFEIFCEALEKTSADNIVPTSYLPFLTAEEVDHDQVFGDNLEILRGLKGKLDPKNVFRAAISYL